ncbi:hypothetical protein BX600DRAFT_500820 [Xylariales sp. PMI_506]|nr:hypothetical protein BX600DRAFT_500820 [Xylariales sp. PMI_506]
MESLIPFRSSTIQSRYDHSTVSSPNPSTLPFQSAIPSHPSLPARPTVPLHNNLPLPSTYFTINLPKKPNSPFPVQNEKGLILAQPNNNTQSIDGRGTWQLPFHGTGKASTCFPTETMQRGQPDSRDLGRSTKQHTLGYFETSELTRQGDAQTQNNIKTRSLGKSDSQTQPATVSPMKRSIITVKESSVCCGSDEAIEKSSSDVGIGEEAQGPRKKGKLTLAKDAAFIAATGFCKPLTSSSTECEEGIPNYNSPISDRQDTATDLEMLRRQYTNSRVTKEESAPANVKSFTLDGLPVNGHLDVTLLASSMPLPSRCLPVVTHKFIDDTKPSYPYLQGGKRSTHSFHMINSPAKRNTKLNIRDNFRQPVFSQITKPRIDDTENIVNWPDRWECEGDIIQENRKTDQYTVIWKKIRIFRKDAEIDKDENGDWIINWSKSSIPTGNANKAMKDDWEAIKAKSNRKLKPISRRRRGVRKS